MRKITIDPYDPASIRQAAKAFAEYQKWVEEKSKELLRVLAEEAANVASTAFGSEVAMSVKPIDGGYSIEANGARVVFLEYGTGTLTTANELAKNLPIKVEKGSWSRTEGKGTYDDWVNSGHTMYAAPDGSYLYDRMPREGMYKAYKYIINNLADKAKEVFA